MARSRTEYKPAGRRGTEVGDRILCKSARIDDGLAGAGTGAAKGIGSGAVMRIGTGQGVMMGVGPSELVVDAREAVASMKVPWPVCIVLGGGSMDDKTGDSSDVGFDVDGFWNNCCFVSVSLCA